MRLLDSFTVSSWNTWLFSNWTETWPQQWLISIYLTWAWITWFNSTNSLIDCRYMDFMPISWHLSLNISPKTFHKVWLVTWTLMCFSSLEAFSCFWVLVLTLCLINTFIELPLALQVQYLHSNYFFFLLLYQVACGLYGIALSRVHILMVIPASKLLNELKIHQMFSCIS